MQDVPAALRRKGLGFRGFLDPTRPAVIDDEHCVRVNYETYLFADTVARDAFRGDVVRFCGLLTDPTSKRRFRPGGDSPVHVDDVTGVVYCFEGERERDMFLRRPDDYRLPGYGM